MLRLVCWSTLVAGACVFVAQQNAPPLWADTQYEPIVAADDDRWRAPHFEVAPELQLRLSQRHPEFVWNSSEYLVERWRVEAVGEHVRAFDDVLVTGSGYIVDEQRCTAVRNGGCVARGTAGWAAKNGSQTDETYECVITLAAHWGAAIWHFPMEALVAAQHVDAATLGKCRLHLPARNAYVKQWCDLAGLPWDGALTGTVRAHRLLAPRMSVCGMPHRLELNWLARIVSHALDVAATHASVLVIRRTKSGRRVHNFGAVERLAAQFATDTNRSVVVHDDSQLPPLVEQLRMFAAAAIIIGPHGAGETMMIASRPGACLIELMDVSWVNVCYMQVAYLRGHHYFGIPTFKGVAPTGRVEAALAECGRLVAASSLLE